MQVLLEHLGVPASDLVAIGDGSNDLGMVAGAGMGVAMGNAGALDSSSGGTAGWLVAGRRGRAHPCCRRPAAPLARRLLLMELPWLKLLLLLLLPAQWAL